MYRHSGAYNRFWAKPTDLNNKKMAWNESNNVNTTSAQTMYV